MINEAHRSWRHIAPHDRLWEVARLREGSMNDSGLSHRLGVALHDAPLTAALGRRSIVLVGMMGAGKSSIGRRLAARLGIPFSDADAEIEEAAGMSVADIFEANGVVVSRDVPHEIIVEEIVTALRSKLGIANACGREDQP